MSKQMTMTRWLPPQSHCHSTAALLLCYSSVPSDSCAQSLASSVSTSEVSGPSKLSKENKALFLCDLLKGMLVSQHMARIVNPATEYS